MEHPLEQNIYRSKDAEKRELERISFEDYDDLRRAAEVHRQTRKHAQ